MRCAQTSTRYAVVLKHYAIAYRAFRRACVCVYVQQFSQCLLFSAFSLRLRFLRSAQNITKQLFLSTDQTLRMDSHSYMTRLCSH